MAYNKFNIRLLKDSLGISVEKNTWLPSNIVASNPDAHLNKTLQEIVKMYLGSEKARSEFIVAPILQALHRNNQQKFSIFSGYEFNIDKPRGLNGFCDFILSSSQDSFLVEAPVFFVVETKKIDIDDNAIAQCGAEMYAAQIFNEQKQQPQKIIYGCVTSAYSWGFLKLENNILTIDPNYVSLNFDNPAQVMSVLGWVVGRGLGN